ncbi:PASTA domain-containing protein [Paenarthrobacter nicotinovorans]|uniref:PASTA domain-containing protein n=1 Tax=Paenarthrobacter nicotinovorans TaxID=29320 RepID=UPI0037F42A78
MTVNEEEIDGVHPAERKARLRIFRRRSHGTGRGQQSRKPSPRWLRLGSAIVMLCVASLTAGVIVGWVARGALVEDSSVTAAAGEGEHAVAENDQTLPMPDVRGLSEADARQVIADAGYDPASVKISNVPSVLTTGTIAAQNPVAGTTNPKDITLSLPAPALMPNLIGKSLDEASRTLSSMGAQPLVNRVYDPKSTTGSVVSSAPASGNALTATPTLIVAGAPDSLPLSSFKASGSCGTISSGSVNGTPITSGVSCSVRRDASTTFWILGRTLNRLQAVVGFEDRAEKASRAKVKITADGNVILDKEIAYGDGEKIDADVTNVLRLEIQVSANTPTGTSSSTSVVLGNATLLGSADAIAALDLKP